MIEIKEGPELDRAVAEAIGIKHQFLEMTGVVVDLQVWDDLFRQSSGVELSSPVRFRPSHDLNAAFAAAEKVGLFGDDGSLRNSIDSSDWVYKSFNQYARAKTPALAICAAILKAKGHDFMAGRMDAMGGLE